MGKKKERAGNQKGAPNHPPSQQSDRIHHLEQEDAKAAAAANAEEAGPQHDPEKIRAHDDVGKDRLFEGRQQHDDAEKNSEKTRLARDMDRHEHGPTDKLSDKERQAKAKRKN